MPDHVVIAILENCMLVMSSPEGLEHLSQRTRLRQFLLWLLPITFTFGLLYGGIGAVFGDVPGQFVL